MWLVSAAFLPEVAALGLLARLSVALVLVEPAPLEGAVLAASEWLAVTRVVAARRALMAPAPAVSRQKAPKAPVVRWLAPAPPTVVVVSALVTGLAPVESRPPTAMPVATARKGLAMLSPLRALKTAKPSQRNPGVFLALVAVRMRLGSPVAAPVVSAAPGFQLLVAELAGAGAGILIFLALAGLRASRRKARRTWGMARSGPCPRRGIPTTGHNADIRSLEILPSEIYNSMKHYLEDRNPAISHRNFTCQPGRLIISHPGQSKRGSGRFDPA